MDKDIYNIIITFMSGDPFMSDAYTDRHMAETLFDEIQIDGQIKSVRLDVFSVKEAITTTLMSK